jgi:N-acetylneuraminic acid mutarotase/fibronectin type 3 domain-containing protein
LFVVGALILQGGYGSIAQAAPLTITTTTKDAWNQGVLSDTDTESSSGDLKLSPDGSWTARTWKTPPEALTIGAAFATDDTDVFVLKGNGDNAFWKYSPTLNTWTVLADAPIGAYGSSLRMGGADTLYAIFGGWVRYFAKYTISTNTWTRLADTPDTTFNGSSLGWTGTDLYLIRAGATQDFWRYDIADDSWSSVAGPPATVGYGADMIWDGTRYFYTPRGGNVNTVYRFDTQTTSWATMSTNYSANISETSFGVFHSGSLYFMRGTNTTNFDRCTISALTCSGGWVAQTAFPAATRYAGMVFIPSLSRFIVFRGNNTLEHWRYNIAGNSFDGPAAYPATTGTGNDMLWDGSNFVYSLRGGNTNNFYRYTISTNTWTSLSVTGLGTINTDGTTMARNGNFIYVLRGNGTNTFYRYDVTNDAGGWTTLTNAPATIGDGGNLVYPGSGNYIYATRGINTASFYAYHIGNNNWTTLDPTDPPVALSIGGRIVSDGTDVYMQPGLGNTNFYRYNVAGNNWTTLARMPFAPYYGADFAFNNGKIYATAGNYSDTFWEYSISGGAWRQLRAIQKDTTNQRGLYNGAVIEFIGSNTILATRGSGSAEVMSYTIGGFEFVASGAYVSQVMDLSFVASWNSLTLTTNLPTGSSVSADTRTSANGTTWSSWQAVTGGTTINSPVNRYLQIRINLGAGTSRLTTPTVSDYVLSYNTDEAPPTNPTTFTCSSQAVSGIALTSGNTYPYPKPSCSWDVGTDSGSGLAGYYVYFGTNASADPVVDGWLQTATSYTVEQPMSTGTYYLRVSAVDAKNNTATATTGFTYGYNGPSPTTTVTRTTTADFAGGTQSNTVTTSDQIRLTGKAGFWQEERLTALPVAAGAGAGAVYKSTTGLIYVLHGNGTTAFRSYNPATDAWTTLSSTGLTVVNAGGMLVNGPGNFLYAHAGNSTNKMYRYDITNDAGGWDDVNAEDSPAAFAAGGYMVSDGTYMYAMRGNNDDAFYRFDPATTSDGQWTAMANVDFGFPSVGLNNVPAVGAGMAFDGVDTIYALQGQTQSGGFAKYTISTNTWTPLYATPLPVIPQAGALITWDPDLQRIFYTAGVISTRFYSYDPANPGWTQVASAPAQLSTGSFMLKVGTKFYVIRGGGNTQMYTYNSAKNTWRVPVSGLFGYNYASATNFGVGYGADMITAADGTVYASRGNYSSDFIKYNPTTGAVTRLTNIPGGVFLGGSLAYRQDTGQIFATLGTGTNNGTALFIYTIATDTWAEQTLDPLPIIAGAGSSMAYDGTRYMYYTRAGATTGWYRYDTQASAGSRWSAALPTTGLANLDYGSDLVISGGFLYTLRGNNINPNILYRFPLSSLPGGTWTALASIPAAVFNDGFMVDGGNGFLYAARGVNANNFYRYDIAGNTWSSVENFPGQVSIGGEATTNGSSKIYAYAGQGTNSWSDAIYTHVIQSNNSSFEESGSYISPAIDLTTVYKWGNLNVTYTVPSNGGVVIETRSSADNTVWSSWASAGSGLRNGSTYSYPITSPHNRYIQVRMSLTSTDGVFSPTVDSFQVSYFQDTTPPSNPTALVEAKSQASGGSTITSSSWYNHTSPYFRWPLTGETDGAVDNAGGSGVANYYVYYGTDNTAIPSTAGSLQSGNTYTASGMTSGQTYYLRVQAVDDAGNVQGSVWDAYTYRFDTTPPNNPTTISVNPVGYTNVDNYTFTISGGASDAASGLLKYQFRTGGDPVNTWYDVSPNLGTTVSLPDVNHTPAHYVDGANIFFLRTVDNAGNVSSSSISVQYYFGNSAPSPPQNLQVAPATNTANSFTFDWDVPAAFIGDASKITYYYSINTLPSEFNTNSTTAKAVGPGAFATQRGTNRFYVVAKDEAGNIDYGQYAYVDFTADTSAPPAPTSVTASDISNKEGNEYRLVISWLVPPIVDPNNFNGYDIYASTVSTGPFTKIANTSGTAYVHTDLAKDGEYFYYVQSVDKTGNRSAASSTTTAIATGRYTKPPSIVSEPSAAPQARSAKITWATARIATSAVEYGTTPDFGSTTGNSPTQLVTSHEVLLGNLQPDTKYFYRAVYLDEDGNTGVSPVGSFITKPAPVVAGLEVTDVTLTSFWVSWESNVPSQGEVLYGVTQAFGSSVKEEPFFTTSHRVKLEGLPSDTVQNFQIRAIDEEGNIFTSDIYTQSTLALPRVSNVRLENKVGVDTPTVIVQYSTNVETTTIVRYVTDGVAEKIYSGVDYALEHELVLDGLQPTKPYILKISGRDRYGNESAQQLHTITTKSDTLPPKVEAITERQRVSGEGAAAEAQLTVRLTTNEPAKVVVEAAQGTGASQFTIVSPEQAISREHTVLLRLGKPNSAYTYRVSVTDEAGNQSVTETKTIVVGRANKGAFEQILAIFSRSFGWLGSVFR